MTNQRADYLLGMLAGTAFGLAVAMIFVEPYWITPDSLARKVVALVGVVTAVVVENVFRWVKRRREGERPDT